MDSLTQLRADLRKAADLLTSDESRYLVDLYYQIQDFRKATANQIRALKETGEPSMVISWAFEEMEEIENQIKRALDRYTDRDAMASWAKSVVGIGPVLSAGLIAHIDFKPWRCKNLDSRATSGDQAKGPSVEICTEKKPHDDSACGRKELRAVGAIWRFAGLDPTSHWGKGQKRPWNARLKTLCWLIGESFVKVSGNPKSLYGRMYLERKALEIERNELGQYYQQAANILATKKIDKSTDAYKAYSQGKLPPAHLHERSKRWAVKLFLSHYFEEGCRRVLGHEPPQIYSIAMMGHVHKIEPEVSDAGKKA